MMKQGTYHHSIRDLGEQVELRKRVVDAMKRHALEKQARYCDCERCTRAKKALDAWKDERMIR